MTGRFVGRRRHGEPNVLASVELLDPGTHAARAERRPLTNLASCSGEIRQTWRRPVRLVLFLAPSQVMSYTEGGTHLTCLAW